MESEADRHEQICSLQHIFDRVSRKFEPKAFERGTLLWFDLSVEERFHLSFPDTEGLEEVYHVLKVPRDKGYDSAERVDIVAFVNEEIDVLTVVASGNLPNNKRFYRNDIRVTDTIERSIIYIFDALLFG